MTHTVRSPRASIVEKYMQLSQGDTIQAEYVWIGGTGSDLRSKTKTLTEVKGAIHDVKQLPEWNFDGSSTKQAGGQDSEVLLIPVKFVPDPFRRGRNIIVLCECLNAVDRTPVSGNNRFSALSVFVEEKVTDEHPWYGIEQEYTLLQKDGRTPLDWPCNGFPAPQGPYYCGVGTNNVCGRHIVEAHYRACLYSALQISGINAEVMYAQWEYQIGPCEGIDAGDQMWLSRYLLQRVAEDFDVVVSFEPKPIKGDWNGAGAHTNYSTKSMRKAGGGGYSAILEAIESLKPAHAAHMAVYGRNNQERLTGKHETAKFSEFSAGVADRGCSIRIPRLTESNKCGYFEDRRPAANCDPYLVTAKLAETTLLGAQ